MRPVLGLLLFAGLQLGWQVLQGGALARAVIGYGVVRPAVWSVRTLTPEIPVRAADRALLAPGGGLNIRNGCEGLEALFLLTAAVLVSPVSWAARGRGVLLACGMVFLINQARVVLLFYAWREAPRYFDALHGTVTPIAVVLLVCACFAIWLRKVHGNAAQTA